MPTKPSAFGAANNAEKIAPALGMRKGVTPSCVALPHGPWPTVLDFLAERFNQISRAKWAERMQQGDVLSADGKPIAPTTRYNANTKLYYYRHVEAEAAIPFEEQIIFQDELLVVADKPHFLPVVPSGRYVQETLLVRLRNRLGIDTLTPMHRIDLETAGLVAFTIQPQTRSAYQALFRQGQVKKTYHAIAPWKKQSGKTLRFPLRHASRLEESPHFMQMREVAGEPNTETLISVLEHDTEWALYQLEPLTGHKHQLRAHMAALGLPIRNDRIYPVLQAEVLEEHGLYEMYKHPLQLLAKRLEFIDPVTGDVRVFESKKALAGLIN